jgi:single-stranded-DNA-specific exonuclease
MLNWIETPPVPLTTELAEFVGGHPLVGQTLVRRGICTPQSARAFLDPNAYSPSPPEDLPDLEQAVHRIEDAIRKGEKIWVWGDFDVDGQTSTTLLVQSLRILGADPGYHIPIRALESHGVNIPNLEPILEAGADLLLTCDTGITAHAALAYAKSRDLAVIVTDHHTLSDSLPPALACVNPRRLPENHPLGTLPGVGTAFKLAEALLKRAGKETEVESLLDLVALGIVADVALQTGDTRYLLQRGLQVLRRAARPGLRAIYDLAELEAAHISEEHIGFILAPRLNALGRLDDANPAVELFSTQDPGRARVLAVHLEGLNARRQLLTSQVLGAAQKQIEQDRTLLDTPVLVLSHPEWPAGVVGIVASELVERYQRPVILLCTPPGEPARGSARSVEGIDITSAIATQQSYLQGFGGHPMAAGLSLLAENIPAFRRGLARAVEKAFHSMGGAQVSGLSIDGEIRLDEVTLDLVADFERLAPFGAGNPPLVLAAHALNIISHSLIGRDQTHRLITLQDSEGNAQKVVWWGGAAWPVPEGRFDLACTLRASNFRGQRELQVEWVDHRLLVETAIELSRPQRILLDYRSQAHPRPLLDELYAAGSIAVWAEGELQGTVQGQDRFNLAPASILAIWTTPPGSDELQTALSQVDPQKIVVFGIDPGASRPEEFLKRLAGLVKFELNRVNAPRCQTSVARLAVATAQRTTAVLAGLAWLQARGMIHIIDLNAEEATLEYGTGSPQADSAVSLAELKSILDETAAFRRYFGRTDIHLLLD